ncbi:MAG: phosphate uptake regulator PhoU [Nitrososphaerota archaeon]|nr:phosphate uptake regulator PhoU [Nitrososphaerota archaeon]MDG7042457.1 phosphate uptake regulator PhoU [Nitrososphaerota archaeon]MDG7045189.1 phosphate uptake regulator PhoU [Nitrososphaerota archaeon]MDG7046861.1 phosphate uptake regulator PhoU [Nitrososphaerota archaeon]
MTTYRKLQQIGGRSLLMTLPRSWVERMGLQKGSSVVVEESASGNLIITPFSQGGSQPRNVVKLDLDGKKEGVIVRLISAAYLNGSDELYIKLKHGPVRNRVLQFIATHMPGFESFSEDESTLNYRFTMNLKSLSPKEIMLRMDRLSSFMCDDLVSGNTGMIEREDGEIDRLYFALIRLLRNAVSNSDIALYYQLSPTDCLDYRLVAHILERFGDDLVNISKYAPVSKQLFEFLDGLKEFKTSSLGAFLGYRAEPIELIRVFDLLSAKLKEMPDIEVLRPYLRHLLELAADISDLSRTLYAS